MEVVSNYHPGDQRLVDKIVYELKAQGIFDQLRKECFADVDTKPAYQNLRQRVEGSVAGFLKEQSWRPDMNKNQVREMLRKTITESGYLETGVERIVDQVVNPKINTVVLPKVEEVVYNYLGIKKPNKNDYKSEPCDLLPQDLEAVSPESEPVDKKDDKSTDTFQDLDESKTEEDESPPFEPLEEQSVYVPHEENSVDSHLSGFSGLVSHESNQSNEKSTVIPMEQDSQMSRNSSDSRLSIVTSDENTKMEVSEDRQKQDDKTKHKTDKHRSRSDKDRGKDSRSRHSSSKDSKSRDRKTSSSKDKDKLKSSKHGSHSSNSSSSSKGKERRDSSRSDKNNKQKDSHSDKSKTREKSSSHKHSHSDKHRKDKDRKKDRLKDDHYSSKEKKNDRRSTDRDSNDGQSSNRAPENHGGQTQRPQETSTVCGDSGNSNHSDNTTKAPINITTDVQDTEVSISPPESQKLKVFKPKCASNMQEALRLRKIRKQLAKLEKKNQLCLTSVNLDSPILLSASINLDDLNQNRTDLKVKQENNKLVSELDDVPTPLLNTVISQDNWDAMEAKLRAEVCSEFSLDDEETCKYFESVDVDKIEFLKIVGAFIQSFEKQNESSKAKPVKRKIDDYKNNNKQLRMVPDKKVKVKKNKVNHDLSEKFPLPLSPAESEKSVGKKEEHVVPLKAKRNSILSNQRYSSDDLYKPRPTFASSRRRGAKNLEN